MHSFKMFFILKILLGALLGQTMSPDGHRFPIITQLMCLDGLFHISESLQCWQIITPYWQAAVAVRHCLASGHLVCDWDSIWISSVQRPFKCTLWTFVFIEIYPRVLILRGNISPSWCRLNCRTEKISPFLADICVFFSLPSKFSKVSKVLHTKDVINIQ